MLASRAHLSARAEVVVRLRVLVADSMLQLLAQAGGSEASLLLLCRQLADRFTKMNPAQTTQLVRGSLHLDRHVTPIQKTRTSMLHC